ncbi:MAG: 5'-nucleotidase domain-containing protein, partial [Planctomycetota bacterium]
NPTLGRLGGPEETSWLELFDQVIVLARKPGYFKRSNPAPPSTQGIAPHVMHEGNILELEERLGVRGPNVLYVGDHIYADLISSKRNTYWRTMLIVPELEEELTVQSALPGMVQQLKETDERRTITEREVMHWKSIESSLDRLPLDEEHAELLTRLKDECLASRKQAMKTLNQFIRQRERLRSRLSLATNPHWGSLFRAGNELTYYGRQLEDFACTYTSRATNLSFYPPNHYFRSAMDYLPHELESV